MSSEEIGDLLMSYWRNWRSSSPVGRGAITQEQYWVLKTLERQGSMKVKELATELGCTPASASVAMKRLQNGGMVKRERSEEDERVVEVSLTSRGEETLRSWRTEQLRAASRLFDGLSPNERRTLRDLLAKARSAVKGGQR